jgi:hypothetical protein
MPGAQIPITAGRQTAGGLSLPANAMTGFMANPISGKAYKPFVLPQRDPSKYDQMLKSFNIPELGREKTPFTARDIEHLYWNVPPEPLK